MEEEELEKQMVLFSDTPTLGYIVLAIDFTNGKESRVKMNFKGISISCFQF